MFRKEMKFKISASLLFCALLTLTSCGNDKKSSTPTQTSSSQQEQQVEDDRGAYQVSFTSLNSSVAGDITGTLNIHIEGDQFVVDQYMENSHPGVRHLQQIYLGTSCPTEAQDGNGDGIIDAVEERSASQDTLIPLDGNLNSQLEGINFGPISNSVGTFFYKKTAILSKLLADLRDIDSLETDGMGKLPFGENLKLEGKVIIIHGVGPEVVLPETVKRLDETLSLQESLPIACGQILRVRF